jgi:hypothetical protein
MLVPSSDLNEMSRWTTLKDWLPRSAWTLLSYFQIDLSNELELAPGSRLHV